MPKDPSASSTTSAKTGPGSTTDGSASDRAQQMRARLGAQRESEELLAEASKVRRSAAEDADAIVAEAEALAAQLLEEAREAAEKTTSEAQERADGILARAYYEAEDLQRHTEEERARIRDEVVAVGRAEIEEFRSRSAGALDHAEDGLRQLGPRLEDAVATVAGVLRSLDELRNGPADPEPAAPTAALELPEVVAPDDRTAEIPSEEMVSEGSPMTNRDDPEARPLGWLFRASQP